MVAPAGGAHVDRCLPVSMLDQGVKAANKELWLIVIEYDRQVLFCHINW